MRAAEWSIDRFELLTIAYQSPLNPLYQYSKFTWRVTIFGDFHYAPSAWAIVVDSSIDSLMNRIALTGAIMLFARATIVVWGSRDHAIVHRAHRLRMRVVIAHVPLRKRCVIDGADRYVPRATSIPLAISISVSPCSTGGARMAPPASVG
ncbi:hypothetical protein [Burkholderia multivorans]|uniref:hypothetical protein n=1 Tax=Burkholderia multivorans TaxID=87883 RepID=UPI000AE051BF|nr:hypothetical protein [Burkholderia multivorans]